MPKQVKEIFSLLFQNSLNKYQTEKVWGKLFGSIETLHLSYTLIAGVLHMNQRLYHKPDADVTVGLCAKGTSGSCVEYIVSHLKLFIDARYTYIGASL